MDYAPPTYLYATLPDEFTPNACPALPGLGGDYTLTHTSGVLWEYGTAAAPVYLGTCNCSPYGDLDVSLWIAFYFSCVADVCHAILVVHIMVELLGEAQNWGYSTNSFLASSTSWPCAWDASNVFEKCGSDDFYIPGSGLSTITVSTAAP
jgi:hypothetical protein